jgi:DNA-binding transcriptional MocR family regulator
MPTETTVDTLRERWQELCALGLQLDMTRGKPCPEQLDLSHALLGELGDTHAADGSDVRNYGGLDGLPEARRIIADILEVEPAQVLMGENASLSLMYDVVSEAMHRGLPDGAGPWSREPKVRVLCPSPGYDRHFHLSEALGLEMVRVAMTAEGPDVEEVARLAGSDPSVKAMFCVPRYSNPTGITYSPEVVRRLASMPTASPDFRLIWDNAYGVHHLYDEHEPLAEILAACREAGHENRAFAFASTSKITLAGAGICGLAASPANVDWFRRCRSRRTIGPDKVNQLRHARLLPDRPALERQMKGHAAILRPKFEAVADILQAELGPSGAATWSRPRGGYFIDLDTHDGCASAVVARAAEAGVKLTPAGATFPYGDDPRDRNIRIAPSFPSLDDLRRATEILAVTILLVSAEKGLL